MTINAVLGGKDEGGPPPRAGDKGVKDMATGHRTVDDAVTAINAGLIF